MNPRAFLLRACAPVLAVSAVISAAPANAAPVTAYELPFPCGQTWTGTTRSNHSPSSNSIDFNRTDDYQDPVVAAAAGTVKVADSVDNSGYGKWVQLDHGNNETSIYAHLDSLVVRAGQTVKAGDLVGYLGTTGNSSGPHLHFEQRIGSSVVKPYFHGAAFTYSVATVSKNCATNTPTPTPTPTPTEPPTLPTPTTNLPLGANSLGDAKADLTVWRRLDPGTFVTRRPGTSALVRKMGTSTDLPLLGHWDGKAVARPGVYRPATSTFVLRTPAGQKYLRFGRPGDVPITGDWDGDGTTDLGVRRGTTFFKRMADGQVWSVDFGAAEDVPVIGDWNGDRIADLGVYSAATSSFSLRVLDKNWTARTTRVAYGAAGQLPVVGDWDGNGTSDLGTWNPSTSTFTLRRATAPTSATAWTQRVVFAAGVS